MAASALPATLVASLNPALAAADGRTSDASDEDDMTLVSSRTVTEEYELPTGETIELTGVESTFAPRSETIAPGTDNPSEAQMQAMGCTKSYTNYGTYQYAASGGTYIGAGARVSATAGCSTGASSFNLLKKERAWGWQNVADEFGVTAQPGESVPSHISEECTGTTYNWRSYFDGAGNSSTERYSC